MNTLSLVSAIVSFTSALVTVLLGALFEARRRRGERAEERRHLISRYRDPMLQAAASLAFRLTNALGDTDNRFMMEDTERHRDYIRFESAYRFARYLGWVEIMFEEVRFLDLGSPKRNRRLVGLLVAVQGTISEPIEGDQTFRLLGGEQWALGQLMMCPALAGEERRRCLGYVEFHTKLKTEPEFERWFRPLLNDIDRFAQDRQSGRQRLVNMHNALLDLIDFLDPQVVWVIGPRSRLPLANGNSGGARAR